MDLSNNYFKSVKVSLKYILKHYELNQPKINDIVIKANKIVIHTLQFMKLYLLNYYNKNQALPLIDKELVKTIMKILCNEKLVGRPPKKEIKELKANLKQFYSNYCDSLNFTKDLNFTYMNTVLDYLTNDIIVMYENNIKQHYVEYIEKYVNIIWKKREMIECIKKFKNNAKSKNNCINNLCSQLRKIKNDLLNIENEDYKSHILYHNWIRKIKKQIIPDKDKFIKNNLYYDLQCNPQDYFPCMIFMMKEIEQHNCSIYNVFPLRSNIIVKHIMIDTTTLVHLLITKKYGNKTDYLFKGNLKKNKDKIWKFFFRTDKCCFNKKNYSFYHIIKTDGVSCSILLLRKDKIDEKILYRKINSKEKYIDEVKDYSKIKDKNIVAIDPNLSDLIYCVDSDTRERNFYRYTQNQRRKETKQKKYQKIILDYKNEKIDGKTVIELETEISLFNRKTLIFKEFQNYIKKKNEINLKLFTFYEKYIFRKLKLNGYWNRQRSEQRMINRFKEIFGDSENTIICIGDFEQRKHRKFKEPTKGKGFRTIFRKNNYQVYLADEFRTSSKCSNCEEGECIKFRKCRNPKPFQSNSILSHGAVMCKTCSALWNRDENSARNIYKIAINAINGKERPKYLSRVKDCNTVISGATSVCELQHTSSIEEAIHPKFT